MRVIINKLAAVCRTYLDRALFGNSHFRNLQLLGPNFALPSSSSEPEPKTVFEQALWFAAPKSKISPGRKREKHGRFVPDPVHWVKCPRCGESKIPLRMCTKNKEICAMREDDWEAYKKSNPTPLAPAATRAEKKNSA